MSLCPYAYLRVSLSGLLTASDQGSLTTFGELFNISALDPLLPTLLIATLCLCVLLTILYYSLVIAWEVFWASRRSPSPLDPSAEVVLTDPLLPTFLIATLCLCALLTILYYSLVVTWEVFWASRRSPSPLDPSAEVVLTP